jgi:polar amino acid transport system substrate-binding protein
MSDFTDTKDRQKSVTFIDYASSFSALLVQKGNPKHIQSVKDLCGATAAAVEGTGSEKLAVQQDANCRNAGRAGVNVLRMDSSATAQTQVRTGRADGLLIDYVLGQYVAAKGQGKVVGEPFYPQFHGAAVRKGNDALRDALLAGFTEIIGDGTYGKILDKWKVQKMAMPAPLVNAATS